MSEHTLVSARTACGYVAMASLLCAPCAALFGLIAVAVALLILAKLMAFVWFWLRWELEIRRTMRQQYERDVPCERDLYGD